MDEKTLVRFNVQNLKYATFDGSKYGTPVAYGIGAARKMALETDTANKKIFGDGRVIYVLMNEKCKNGTMSTNNVDNDYEIAMGRKMKVSNGLADVAPQVSVMHAIYFETCGAAGDGSKPIAKTWLYGVTSTRPAESFDQNTEDINESSFDTPLVINGTEILASDGKTVYKDPKTGNAIIAWQMTVVPGDAGYDTFENAVVLPTMAASTN